MWLNGDNEIRIWDAVGCNWDTIGIYYTQLQLSIVGFDCNIMGSNEIYDGYQSLDMVVYVVLCGLTGILMVQLWDNNGIALR